MQYETWSKDKLISRIFDLEAAVQSLKGVSDLDKTALLASEFRLSPLEARAVAVLSSGRIITRRGLIEAIYFDRHEPEDERIATTFISKIRAKLLPFGVTIETIHGTGCRMHGFEAVRSAMSGDRLSTVIDAEIPPHARRRERWVPFLEEIKRTADSRGVSEFKSSTIRQTVGISGGLTQVLRALEREGALRILQRPTRAEPKRHWKVALKGRAA